MPNMDVIGYCDDGFMFFIHLYNEAYSNWS